MAPRALGALLAVVAVLAFALALAGGVVPKIVPGWWDGHPMVGAQTIERKEVHVGLLGAHGCNLGETVTCQELSTGGRLEIVGLAELAALGLAIATALALVMSAWRIGDHRKLLGKLVLIELVLVGAGGGAIFLLGPDLKTGAQHIEVPIGIGMFAAGGGIVAGALASVIAIRLRPEPLRLKTSMPRMAAGPPQPAFDVRELLRSDHDGLRPAALGPEPRMGGVASPGGQLAGPAGPLGPPANAPLFEGAPQLRPLYDVANGGVLPAPSAPPLPTRAPTPMPRDAVGALMGIPTPPPLEPVTPDPNSPPGMSSPVGGAQSRPRSGSPSVPPPLGGAPPSLGGAPPSLGGDPTRRSGSSSVPPSLGGAPPSLGGDPTRRSGSSSVPPSLGGPSPSRGGSPSAPPPLGGASPSPLFGGTKGPVSPYDDTAHAPTAHAPSPYDDTAHAPGSSQPMAARGSPAAPGTPATAARGSAPEVPGSRTAVGAPVTSSRGRPSVPPPLGRGPGAQPPRSQASKKFPTISTAVPPMPTTDNQKAPTVLAARDSQVRVKTNPQDRGATAKHDADPITAVEIDAEAKARAAAEAKAIAELAGTHTDHGFVAPTGTHTDRGFTAPSTHTDRGFTVPSGDHTDRGFTAPSAPDPTDETAAPDRTDQSLAAPTDRSSAAPQTGDSVVAPPPPPPTEHAAPQDPEDLQKTFERAPKSPAPAPEPAAAAKVPISTAPASLPPPKKATVAMTTGPTPACPQCEAPMAWVEEHLRFYCAQCRMYF